MICHADSSTLSLEEGYLCLSFWEIYCFFLGKIMYIYSYKSNQDDPLHFPSIYARSSSFL